MNSPSALTCSSRPLSHTNPQKPLGSCTAGEQASLRAQAAGAVVDSNVLTGKRNGLHIPGGSAERVQLTMESTAMMGGSEGEAGREKQGKGWWSQLSDTEGLSWTQTGTRLRGRKTPVGMRLGSEGIKP